MTQLVVERMDSNAYGYKLAPKYAVISNPYNRGRIITDPSQYVYTAEKGGGGLNLPGVRSAVPGGIFPIAEYGPGTFAEYNVGEFEDAGVHAQSCFPPLTASSRY